MPSDRLLDEESHRAIGPLGQPGIDGDPALDLTLGARPERVEPGGRASSLGCRPAWASLALRGRAPGGRSRWGWWRLVPGEGVQEVIGPLVGHDRAGERQDQEDGRTPDADDVVPVEVARASAHAGPEQGDRLHRLPRPPARPPEADAEDHEPEEAQVGRAGDGPEVLARAEPAMPLDDLVERVMDRREAPQHD